MYNQEHCEAYNSAKSVNYIYSDYLTFLWNFLSACVEISLVLVTETFTNIFKFFNFTKPKTISGQLALVTGGANGLGRAIAFRLAQENCNVVIIDVNLNEAQKTASEIAEKFKVATSAFRVDVSDYEAVQKLKEDIESSLGSVDILVNNAGILAIRPFYAGSSSDLQKVIDVNLTSHFWTVRTFLKSMLIQKRGHIVAISSMGGKLTIPNACAYCATKYGVRGFMNALFDELALNDDDQYVKTTCVFPYFINTRKELCDILDQTKEVAPRMTPQYVADEVVKGMLMNKRNITLPYSAWILQLTNWLPTQALKTARRKLVQRKN